MIAESTKKSSRMRSKLPRAQHTTAYRDLRRAYLGGKLGTSDAPNRTGNAFDAFWRGYFDEEISGENRDERIAFSAGRDASAKERAREISAKSGINGVEVTDFQRRVYNAVPDHRFADASELANALEIDARRCGSALVALAEKGLLSRREGHSRIWKYRRR